MKADAVNRKRCGPSWRPVGHEVTARVVKYVLEPLYCPPAGLTTATLLTSFSCSAR